MRNKNNGWKTNKRNGNSRPRKRDKEFEVNLSDDKVNMADLRHVVTSGHKDNDPRWYANIPALVKDAATIPMSLPNGVLTNPLQYTASDQIVGKRYYSTPAILTVGVAPTIGRCVDQTSAANLAAQQFYTLVRKANSGAVNYDKTDLMMTVIAMDSAYMLYEHLLRWYRLLGTYNYMNRYMPDDILTALGASASLGRELADFRGILDLFAYKLASVNIPDQFDFVHRHSWLFTNIYTDARDIKAQLYAYIPTGLYVWTEGVNSEPTSLVYTPMSTLFGTTKVTSLDQIQNAIDTIMNPILGSQDVGIMSGDMAKAFGEGGMIKIKPVEDYATIEPVYSPEVLLQMSNSLKCVNSWDQSKFTITVDNSNLQSGPFLIQELTEAYDLYPQGVVKPVLNFIDTDPSPDNIMVATRLTSMGKVIDGKLSEIIYGTEVVQTYTIWFAQPNSDGQRILNGTTFDSAVGVGSSAAPAEINATLGLLCQIAKFDWAPAMYVFEAATGAGANTYVGNTIDYCNYTYLEYEDLRQLHDVAVMSLFAVKDYNYSL